MNAMKIAVGCGIAIIFPMVVHAGVSTFSPAPDRNDYRPPEWEVLEETATAEQRQAREAERREIRERYDAHAETFARHLFWVAVPLGLAALITGAMLNIPAVGTGLVFGAIITLIDAYGNFWQYLPDALRFASLLIAFGVLVIIGYRQFSAQASSEASGTGDQD